MKYPINIISSYAGRTEVTGPGKFLLSLTMGLDRISQPFVINRELGSTPRLYVHSDARALLELPDEGVISLLGPCLGVLPRDLPTKRSFPRSFYLQPSDWALEVWVRENFAQCPLRRYSFGIDTDRWRARQPTNKDAPILLYFKNRFPVEYERVEREINRLGLPYILIRYGSYKEADYLEALQQCSFIVWLGRQESQGIALQEALASDVPILVLDALSVFDVYARGYKFPERVRSLRSTSAPYFDERCGRIVDSLDELSEGIAYMFDHFHEFRPREYVLDNLTLERRANAFVQLFAELEEMNGAEGFNNMLENALPFAPSALTTLRVRAHQALRSPENAAKWLSRHLIPG